MKMDGIKIDGHRGKWYVIDELVKFGKVFYLLEHETYGEEAPWIAIDSSYKLIMEDIVDGASELADYLDENPLLAK